MVISTQAAKAKGRRFQQWVRDQILATFPSLEKDDVKSTSMGASGADVQLSPAAQRHFPYGVECKSHAKFAVYGILDQAQTNTKKGQEPIVFLKADRREPLAVLSAKHFFELLKGRND